jgi:hypothetical protein
LISVITAGRSLQAVPFDDSVTCSLWREGCHVTKCEHMLSELKVEECRRSRTETHGIRARKISHPVV